MPRIDWIEDVLRPELVDLDQREWTRESFMEFHRTWSRRIHAALVSGHLTIEEADAAYTLLDGAMPSVAGISFKRQSFRVTARKGSDATARRVDPDEI